MQTRSRRGIILGMAIGLSGCLPMRADAIAHACTVASLHAQRQLVLRQVIADRVLHQSWALFQDCAHPERPLEMYPVSASSAPVPVPSRSQNSATPGVPRAQPTRATLSFSTSALPVVSSVTQISIPSKSSNARTPLLVHAGDRVHLWSASANVRLEIEAIALEYGRAGQVIHLRRVGSDAAQRAMLAGIVDGVGSAELLP